MKLDRALRGLQALKDCLPGEIRGEFDNFEARLLGNLRREQLYGSTETIRAERAEIVHSLNQIAEQCCGKSFNDLVYSSQVTWINANISQSAGSEGLMQRNKGRKGSVILPQVKVELLTRIIPTAYCHQLDGEDFPLVTVIIDNTDSECNDVSLQITSYIEKYSNTITKSVEVTKGNIECVSLLPVLQVSAVKDLNEIRPTTVHVIIDYGKPMQHQQHYTERIRLHARNIALLALEVPDGSVVDLTSYLAAWVTPNRLEIENVLRQAVEYSQQRSLIRAEYIDSPSERANIIRDQAQAFFLALQHAVHLVYIDRSFTPKRDSRQILQRVRLPTETLKTGGANCIDGVVLFARRPPHNIMGKDGQ